MTVRVGVVVTPYGEHSIEFIREAEQLGVDSIWVPEFWAGDALTRSGSSPARRRRSSGDRHRAARRPNAGDAGDVGTVDAGSLRRTVRARHRNQRTASHGGMARRPLRQARATHTRDHRHHPRGHRRRASRVPRRDLRAAAARRRGPQHPFAHAADARSDLCRVARPEQPSAHGGARRRVDRQLLLPRDRRRVLRPDSRRRRPRRTLVRRSRPHRRRRARVHRRRRSRWAPACRGLRVHLRGDGLGDHELLQQRLRTAGLRRRRT